MILSGICDERILVLSQNLVWWSWTFLGAGHFKINNPAPSVGRPLPNCYVLAPATPDHGCRPRASATDDHRPPARHSPGPWHKHNSWKCEQKHPSLHKTQSRTEVPSYCIAGRQGTMVPCTGRDGPRNRPNTVRTSACTVQYIQGRPRHRARWRPV